jgi:segregation and condensation protein A
VTPPRDTSNPTPEPLADDAAHATAGAMPESSEGSRDAMPPSPDDANAGRPGSVTIRLERFEGPLDLLLHLIKRDEIDIYDIPIAHITQQYLVYIDLMRQLDLEIAGEFLVMAATLMRIKAKMLLPLPAVGEEEEEGDPRDELVQRLVEYRQFKEAAGNLKLKEEERRLLHQRGMVPSEDEAGPLPLAPATLFDLLDALNRVLSRVPDQAVYEIEADTHSVEEKMELLGGELAQRGTLHFAQLLGRCRTRSEMIVTFIALLELIKLGQAMIVQDETFGEITIVACQPEGSVARASSKT